VESTRAATLKSLAATNDTPQPAALPSTAVKNALGPLISNLKMRVGKSIRMRPWMTSRRFISEMSPPEQKLPPAPVSTMAWHASFASMSSNRA